MTQYDLSGGTSTNKVPVANTGGTGTADAHWREADMGRELMTGFINASSINPLSAITVGPRSSTTRSPRWMKRVNPTGVGTLSSRARESGSLGSYR